jgi:hypothetical protein
MQDNIDYINNRPILDVNFYWASKFYNGFAKVMVSQYEYNFIGTKGEFLSKTHFLGVSFFNKEGFAEVKLQTGEWVKINTKGEIV